MNRSYEVKEGQLEEREVKRSRIEEESSEPSDFNPFLVEPILRKLLKKVDTVAQLKDLRKMCVLWDNVNIEELEDRAFKGKLKAIDFKWTDRFKSKEEAEKEFVEFIEDTRAIPRLFNSFKFNVTESLKVLQAHTPFFKAYTIFRVDFVTPLTNEIKELIAAIKYFLSLIGTNLKEMQMYHAKIQNPISFEPKNSNWPNPEQELLLPNLEKLYIGIRWDQLADFFKSALTGSGHITSLKLPSLPGADIGSFPGLDPARMTRLDIRCGFEGTSIALKYTIGLLTLVEKGMRLRDLGLRFDENYRDDTPATFAHNLPFICSNLTHFFDTQSRTLTTLDFLWKFAVWPRSEDEIGAQVAKYRKIQLPIFQALHTLSFDHHLRINQNGKKHVFSLFEANHSLLLHFPSLVNLTFDCECSMGLFFDNPGQVELAGEQRFQFKRLEIMHNCMYDRGNLKTRKNWKMLCETLIGSVDYLKISSGFLNQAKIPWADSLRQLHVYIVNDEPPKLTHLKNLETLTIFEDKRKIRSEKIYLDWGSLSDEGSNALSFQETVSDYLSLFSEAIGLSLAYIKFIGLKMEKTEEEGIKEEFIRYFPYPVIFD